MKHILSKLTLATSLAIAIAGCDGGSSGTGISTAALGNVASVNTALRPASSAARPTMIARLLGWLRPEREALARGALEDIGVSIEGTTLSTRTDGQGQFALRGNFAGPVGMIFDLPDGGRARLVIVVPRGGEVTLTDVHLDERTSQATADNQRVRFGGVVNGADCRRDAATMVSRETPTDGNTYTVLLGGAVVRDPNGNPLACGDLFAGQSTEVDGEVRSDGDVEAESVDVERESGDGGGNGSGDGGTSGSGPEGGGSGEGGGGDGGGTSGSSGDGGETSRGEGGSPK